MFLNKRSNGFYYINYLISEGKWKRISTQTTLKPEANKFFSEFKKNINQRKSPPLLSEFVKQYIAYSVTNHAPGTTKRAEYVLTHFKTFIGEKYIDRITPQDIEAYKSQRLAKVTPVTVNIELRTLKAAFGVAVDWELI